MRIILASGSPRRKEIFSELVKKFEIIPAIGEEVISKNSPSEVVMELSHQKAMEVYGIEKSKNCNEELLIIGADTVVSLNDKIIGKPKNIEEAFEIIKELSGRTHKVYTGVTIIHFKNDNEDIETFFERTYVSVEELSNKEITEYIKTNESMDKAGGYAIQGLFKKYIKKIDGDYYNVVGLPVAGLWKRIKHRV